MTHYPPSDDASKLMLFPFFFSGLLCSLRPTRRPTLSYQRLHTVQPLNDAQLYDKIRRTAPNKYVLQVLGSFLVFNKCVSSTYRNPT